MRNCLASAYLLFVLALVLACFGFGQQPAAKGQANENEPSGGAAGLAFWNGNGRHAHSLAYSHRAFAIPAVHFLD